MTSYKTDWQNLFDDQHLDQLIDIGWVCFDEVYDSKNFKELQKESKNLTYKAATIASGGIKTAIRGDHIVWIEPEHKAGYAYLNSIEALAQFFNQTLFAGIRRCEAHYATYDAGRGYQWHFDNRTGQNERIFSAVFYLNENWQSQDGGALSLIDKRQQQHQFLPVANRLIIFDSQLKHQVEIAHKRRFSIATWLRQDI